MQSRCVLVIDDEDHIREVAQVSLEAIGGWRVLTAASGAAGVAVASSERPDAILLDVMMPELDGPATVGRLRADALTRDIPVVLLTAKVQPADHQRFAQLDVSAVLAKPFDPMTLPGQISDALGWNA